MDWLKREISTGFQKLICLGLERQPAAEVIEGTVLFWLEVLTDGKVWDETFDAPRFRRAFIRYGSSTAHSWPQPCDILALLPQREEFKALPAKAADPDRASRIIDDLAKHLGMSDAH